MMCLKIFNLTFNLSCLLMDYKEVYILADHKKFFKHFLLTLLVCYKNFNECMFQGIENNGCESKSRSLISVMTQNH